MTNFLLQAIGLKKRISFGYIITGLITLIIVLLSYGVLNRLSGDFREIVRFSQHSADNMAALAQMSEMQRQALIYIYEGHGAAGDQVDALYESMLDKITWGHGLGQEEIDSIVTAAKAYLNAYHDTFAEVRKQREIQKHLVRSEFRIHASRAQYLIEELAYGTEEAYTSLHLEYHRMLNALLQVEKNAYRYFDSLDAEFVKAATASIQETRNMLAALLGASPLPDVELLEEIVAVLHRYESSFLEAVQRTRGYLYLINVVMAAQAYETIYQSKKLSQLMLSESERIQQEVLQKIESTVLILLLSSLVLLLFIGLFSYTIGRSITVPLKRLTRTFKLLTSGSADAEIPAYRLHDELGDLTRAAASFKQKNIELEANKKELERSNDELEQFVYTVSHDLKSPLVTSMGFIGIIRKLAKDGKHDQALSHLDRVVKANERMSQLINDLLELSRVGRIDMDKKRLDLAELVQDFASNQKERLAAARFTLIVEPGLPVIHANESRTLQLFENILSNALKYAHTPEREGRLIIRASSDGQWHHIYCIDNGPGIPKEYREKIFALFYRLDVHTEGTGIGLAVAKKIMKFHGGDIWAESWPDTGAVFHITFPKYRGEDNG
jgi:signal transduction histidine kinase